MMDLESFSKMDKMIRIMRKPTMRFPNSSDTNQAVQAQQMLEILDSESTETVLHMQQNQRR